MSNVIVGVSVGQWTALYRVTNNGDFTVRFKVSYEENSQKVIRESGILRYKAENFFYKFIAILGQFSKGFSKSIEIPKNSMNIVFLVENSKFISII